MAMTTKNGYNYYLAASAFQKAIRRCDEDEAVFWAIEMFESGYIKHLWNRMHIIVSEDIGLAEPNFPQKFFALKQLYDYLEINRPKNLSKRLTLLQTVIEMTRAKKSRYVDMAYMVYWSKHEERAKDRAIPDYAYDMHTIQGKRMGRGLEHFYEEGAKINNSGEVSGEDEMKAHCIEIELSEKSENKEAKITSTPTKKIKKPNITTGKLF